MTVISGVMFSDQLSSMPVAPVEELVSLSVQMPATHRFGSVGSGCRPYGRPGPRASSAGWYVPVNGAVPVVIEFSAESSKTVLTKFEPVPPTPENKVTCVPSGAIRTAGEIRIRRERGGELDGDVGDLERAVVARNGQRRGECAGAGRARRGGDDLAGAVVDGKYCGPEIEPVGPMIWSTWLGVKVLACIGRSNVTFSVLVVPSVIRLPLALSPPGTEVLKNLRAGHDDRQRVLIERAG